MSMLTSTLLMVAAAQAAAEPAYPNCADPVTQSDMRFCAARDYEAADVELNRQWRITSDHMKAADAASPNMPGKGYFEVLLDSQRAWLKFRDTQCINAGYRARGGSMQPTLVALCHIYLTQERTRQLKLMIQEGG
ncbi:DUF1311 domain-containing protein [Altererythrobacter xixiisoli]|uniref:DUF1311 domain-containing protein n=1 Tax=Croceibacterium xixiisoli TaxID=1476466 RepID=A0A6I4TWM6_9SPHN|nr:lysozyme inhibitor LprI family protein [Croceibacterium xixiisoli]MXO99187.1 DUF1311 domain-containing protein [Croceibacterium xixiisoli]